MLGISTFSLNAQDIETGLVARYSFCGDLSDASGNDNDGIFMGPGSPNYTTDAWGNANQALYFNGISDYVVVEPSESMNSPLEEATVSCWVNYLSADYGQWVVMFAKTNGTQVIDRQYSLGINATTNQIYWHTTYVAEAELEFNTWYHIAITYTPEILKCYLNGEFIGEAIPQDPLQQNDHPFEIGRDTPVEIEYYEGTMDEINIYNRALSQEDITTLYEYNGCEASFAFENTLEDKVNVYPSPARTVLFVEIDAPAELREFQLLSSNGSIIYQLETSNKNVDIDLNTLKSGVYYFLIREENGVYFEKIIKE